jgi:siroheme synthase
MLSAGWRPGTPAAVITDASQDSQRVWHGDLAALERGGDDLSADGAHVIVIGDVVGVGRDLAAAAGEAAAACVMR